MRGTLRNFVYMCMLFVLGVVELHAQYDKDVFFMIKTPYYFLMSL